MENRARNLPAKLIPKDISQSLGKLPPQATDLEEVVLGAMMIEVRTIERLPFLKPQHFYLESHQEVFRAIKHVHDSGARPDFRMVVAQLRMVGKLELVGGAAAVVEITSKLQSAENVEHHARVVVEMAIKRNLIQIAGRIHEQAYEDTTDVFQLLKDTQDDIAYLEDRETNNNGPEKIKALWEKYGITTKPLRPEPLIMIGDALVCTVGNISLLIGKKKSRKSLLVVLLISIFLKSRLNLADEVVMFDTEQEEYDVWEVRDRIFRMTNQNVPIYCLRGLNPHERRDFIQNTVIHWHKPLKIAVIDGIRDCMVDINSVEETSQVMSWMMQMNYERKIHFINVLHQNKTDSHARGHIGSELLNKAEVTIEVEYVDDTGFSRVKCESSRRKPFEPFEFTHGPTGLPEIQGTQLGQKAAEIDDFNRLEKIFDNSSLRFKQLTQLVTEYFAGGETKAKKRIREWVMKKWILKDGKDHDPKATYRLNISRIVYEQPTPIPNHVPEQNDIIFPNVYDQPEPPDIDMPF